MCSFGLYAFTQDEPLSSSSAFTILVLVDQLRMAMLMIPQGIFSFFVCLFCFLFLFVCLLFFAFS